MHDTYLGILSRLMQDNYASEQAYQWHFHVDEASYVQDGMNIHDSCYQQLGLAGIHLHKGQGMQERVHSYFEGGCLQFGRTVEKVDPMVVNTGLCSRSLASSKSAYVEWGRQLLESVADVCVQHEDVPFGKRIVAGSTSLLILLSLQKVVLQIMFDHLD